jgi:hypothetical protein
MVELGIARGDVGAQRVRAVFSQQILALTLHAEVGAEVAAAIHHVLGGVIQVGRTRVLEFGVP